MLNLKESSSFWGTVWAFFSNFRWLVLFGGDRILWQRFLSWGFLSISRFQGLHNFVLLANQNSFIHSGVFRLIFPFCGVSKIISISIKASWIIVFGFVWVISGLLDRKNGKLHIFDSRHPVDNVKLSLNFSYLRRIGNFIFDSRNYLIKNSLDFAQADSILSLKFVVNDGVGECVGRIIVFEVFHLALRYLSESSLK